MMLFILLLYVQFSTHVSEGKWRQVLDWFDTVVFVKLILTRLAWRLQCVVGL